MQAGSSDRGWSRRVALAVRALSRWRPSWRWLVGVLRGFVVSFLAFAVTLWIVPGDQVPERGSETVASLVVVTLVVGALLRPFLIQLTVLTGVVGLLLSGLLAQTLVLGVALSFVPGIEPLGLPELALTAWGVAVVAAFLNWILDTSTEDVFLAQLMGRSIRTARSLDATGPGMLVIQLDGVAHPLLRQAAAGGAIPFLQRSFRSGTHGLRRWHTGLPSTTPAGQAVLLHGADQAIPAFRWYDKTRRRVLECSRPADAAEAESDFSTGDGLLAYGGVSVANLFSGDAPTCALTMSRPRLPGSERGAAAYATAPGGFARSLVLFAGQVITEWYQARRQRLRNVEPRVSRSGAFLLLRGLTTVLLRDLAVSIVADQLARGAPVVYVDLVDYDEVAHHAGPTRPESMRTLEAMDRLVEFLVELAAEMGRDYEVVLVSDHGQSQGTTFLQREGMTLADAVTHLVAGPAARGDTQTSETRPPETLGPANLLAEQAGGRLLGRLAAGRTAPLPAGEDGGVEVVASGSVAHVYLTRAPGRLSTDEVELMAPRLLPGLCELRSVGLVVTRDTDGVLVAENADGVAEVSPDGSVLRVEGDDPLTPYGPRAAADLAALDSKAHVGDVVVLGHYDTYLNEVAAFEELVGSHGGLGGWQSDAFFMYPAGWELPPGELSGAEVHRVLVDRLVTLGLRPAQQPSRDPVAVP